MKKNKHKNTGKRQQVSKKTPSRTLHQGKGNHFAAAGLQQLPLHYFYNGSVEAFPKPGLEPGLEPGTALGLVQVCIAREHPDGAMTFLYLGIEDSTGIIQGCKTGIEATSKSFDALLKEFNLAPCEQVKALERLLYDAQNSHHFWDLPLPNNFLPSLAMLGHRHKQDQQAAMLATFQRLQAGIAAGAFGEACCSKEGVSIDSSAPVHAAKHMDNDLLQQFGNGIICSNHSLPKEVIQAIINDGGQGKAIEKDTGSATVIIIHGADGRTAVSAISHPLPSAEADTDGDTYTDTNTGQINAQEAAPNKKQARDSIFAKEESDKAFDHGSDHNGGDAYNQADIEAIGLALALQDILLPHFDQEKGENVDESETENERPKEPEEPETEASNDAINSRKKAFAEYIQQQIPNNLPDYDPSYCKDWTKFEWQHFVQELLNQRDRSQYLPDEQFNSLLFMFLHGLLPERPFDPSIMRQLTFLGDHPATTGHMPNFDVCYMPTIPEVLFQAGIEKAFAQAQHTGQKRQLCQELEAMIKKHPENPYLATLLHQFYWDLEDAPLSYRQACRMYNFSKDREQAVTKYFMEICKNDKKNLQEQFLKKSVLLERHLPEGIRSYNRYNYHHYYHTLARFYAHNGQWAEYAKLMDIFMRLESTKQDAALLKLWKELYYMAVEYMYVYLLNVHEDFDQEDAQNHLEDIIDNMLNPSIWNKPL